MPGPAPAIRCRSAVGTITTGTRPLARPRLKWAARSAASCRSSSPGVPSEPFSTTWLPGHSWAWNQRSPRRACCRLIHSFCRWLRPTCSRRPPLLRSSRGVGALPAAAPPGAPRGGGPLPVADGQQVRQVLLHRSELLAVLRLLQEGETGLDRRQPLLMQLQPLADRGHGAAPPAGLAVQLLGFVHLLAGGGRQAQQRIGPAAASPRSSGTAASRLRCCSALRRSRSAACCSRCRRLDRRCSSARRPSRSA